MSDDIRFPLDDAERFYRLVGLGFLRADGFVRITKDGHKPVFKPIRDGAIYINDSSDPAWLPIVPDHWLPGWAPDMREYL